MAAVDTATSTAGTGGVDGRGDRYKWIALSNTTLGILMATINSSILLIALPGHLPRDQAQPAGAGQHLATSCGSSWASCW